MNMDDSKVKAGGKTDYTELLGDLNLKNLMLAESKKSSKLIPLSPESTFKVAWDMIGAIIIVYQAVVVPFRFCFGVAP
jgi:hypothetical protein